MDIKKLAFSMGSILIANKHTSIIDKTIPFACYLIFSVEFYKNSPKDLLFLCLELEVPKKPKVDLTRYVSFTDFRHHGDAQDFNFGVQNDCLA